MLEETLQGYAFFAKFAGNNVVLVSSPFRNPLESHLQERVVFLPHSQEDALEFCKSMRVRAQADRYAELR
jgi:hypothetical protein